MKVHELIEQLKKMPQDLEVFVYSSIEEGDGYASEVKLCHKHPKCNWQAKEYYCQGDSEMAIYLEDNNITEAVVIGQFCGDNDFDYDDDEDWDDEDWSYYCGETNEKEQRK